MLSSDGNRNLLLAVVVIFLSRIPFLFSGYGSEEDAWGLILVARNIDLTGIYEVSRMPGHPVQELLLSQLWQLPSWALNLLTAIVSTMGVYYFMLSLRSWGISNYIPAGFMLAFTPIFFINSTNVMDYTWALSLVMISMYLVASDRLVMAGVVLGLAVGFRITAGAMGIAFAVYLLSQDRPVLRIMMLGVSAIVTAVACYLPAFQVYGTDFFTYYEYFPYPPFLKNLYKGTIGAWGVIGFAAIVLGSFLAVMRLKQRGFLPDEAMNENQEPEKSASVQPKAPGNSGVMAFRKQLDSAMTAHRNKWLLILSVAVIILYTWSFLKIPQKSAFVIPVIPFIALTFAILLTGKQMRFIAGCMVLSCFVLGINLDDPIRGSKTSSAAFRTVIGNTPVAIDPLSGMVTADNTKRRQKMNYAREVAERLSAVSEKTVVIAGWWQNEINYFLLNRKPQNLELVYYVDEKTLTGYHNSGYVIYYLPEQDYWNDVRFDAVGFTGRHAVEFPEKN